MNKALTFFTGAGIGAGLMFMFDPDRGRRRRVLVRDKTAATWDGARDVVRKSSRDIGNRAHGIAAGARSAFAHWAEHGILLDRIHAKIGRVVSHPHAIHVTEHQGRVVVSGPVLASEVRDLLKAVRGINGVESVENRLDIHDTSAMPALRGGSPRAAGARGSAASARS